MNEFNEIKKSSLFRIKNETLAKCEGVFLIEKKEELDVFVARK